MEKVIVNGIEFVKSSGGYYAGQVSKTPYVVIRIWHMGGEVWHYTCNAVGIVRGGRAHGATNAQKAAQFAFNRAHLAASDLCDVFVRAVNSSSTHPTHLPYSPPEKEVEKKDGIAL